MKVWYVRHSFALCQWKEKDICQHPTNKMKKCKRKYCPLRLQQSSIYTPKKKYRNE